MAAPVFRLVCTPDALTAAPAAWARELLQDGEIALLPGGGLEEINRVAHHLDLVSVRLLRGEAAAEEQDETVLAYAGGVALVWIAPGFAPRIRTWARERGPMTLLVEAGGPLPEDEQRRITRFVAALGRQSE